jgi:hypothetical protein
MILNTAGIVLFVKIRLTRIMPSIVVIAVGYSTGGPAEAGVAIKEFVIIANLLRWRKSKNRKSMQ